MECILCERALLERPMGKGRMDKGCKKGLVDWCGDRGRKWFRRKGGPEGWGWRVMVIREDGNLGKEAGWVDGRWRAGLDEG
jgi:hypothetical protein